MGASPNSLDTGARNIDRRDIPIWLASTLAADASGGQGVLPNWIHPLTQGSRIAGYVCTASIAEGDTLGLKKAIDRGPIDGTILVALGSPTAHRAVIGEVFGSWLASRGFTAYITDGLARDTSELRRIPMLVWCRGTSPVGATRDGPGSAGEVIAFGDVSISPGDLLVADDDGVVVWPQERIEELLALAADRKDRDEARLGRIRDGMAPDG